MLPNADLENRYRIERCKDLRREADRWRLEKSCARPTWLARQRCQILCHLGGGLIRVGRYLQATGSLPARPAHLLKRV